MTNNISETVRELLDAWNAHDSEKAASFYAYDYEGVDVGQASVQHGPQARVRILDSYVRAFPDLTFNGETVVEGSRAVLIWTMRGTHQGAFMRIPPTGRSVEIRGVSVLTFENGKIIRGLNIWDTAGFLRAVGLLPDL